MDIRFIGTIEARMGSSRLPGKTLMDVAGRPLLERVIGRIKLCKSINGIVVATTKNKLDDPIEDLAARSGVKCYRGSAEDVLERVVEAAEWMKADVTVQFGGDSPFIDWQLVEELIQLYLDDPDSDLVSNCLELTYPLGVYAYVVPMTAMKIIDGLAKAPAERSDVTRYLWEHPEQFKLLNKQAPAELRRPELRLTVDYPEDLELANKIYAALFPAHPDFTTIDVIKFLDEHPELKRMNDSLIQRAAPHIKRSAKL